MDSETSSLHLSPDSKPPLQTQNPSHPPLVSSQPRPERHESNDEEDDKDILPWDIPGQDSNSSRPPTRRVSFHASANDVPTRKFSMGKPNGQAPTSVKTTPVDPDSADETTAILSGTGDDRIARRDYQTNHVGDKLSRKDQLRRRNSGGYLSPPPPRQGGMDGAGDDDSQNSEKKPSRWKQFIEKYGSVELENKGSVARDHLALERTFLAWLRTSLSFASIGIAITQLFRLNTALSTENPTADEMKLRRVGRPLGATFLGIGIISLFIGFHRYFESQHYVILGRFPASRGSVILMAFLSGALIIASFVVLLTIAPNSSLTP